MGSSFQDVLAATVLENISSRNISGSPYACPILLLPLLIVPMQCVGSNLPVFLRDLFSQFDFFLPLASYIAPPTKMCYYMDLFFYYKNCRASPRHIQSERNWDECKRAKANGHRCYDASPAKGLNGEVIQLAASQSREMECPQCPPTWCVVQVRL